MHSSRMRTTAAVAVSGGVCQGVRVPGRRCLPRGGLPRGVSAQEEGIPPPIVDIILDTGLRKYYLSATTVADGNELGLTNSLKKAQKTFWCTG